MEENDYVKLTMMQVKGMESVEVDVSASKDTLTTMFFSAMCNNQFLANAVINATKEYYHYVEELDFKAKLN
jgi:hypothetical protein